jgi:hypothetical protein
MKNMKALCPNIPHNNNARVKQLGLTHNHQIPKGKRILEHVHAKQDMTYEFDKEKCRPSTAHRNDIMNS